MKKFDYNDFRQNGITTFDSPDNFKDYLKSIIPKANKLFPDYNNPSIPNAKTIVSGVAVSERLNNSLGMPKKLAHPNPLYGKRVVYKLHDLPIELSSIIDHPTIKNTAKEALNTNEIAFHNGSLSTVYPGATGNDNIWHSDTVNFTNEKDAFKSLFSNKYIVNIIVYLQDTDDDLAPLKSLKKTHLPDVHQRVNSVVSGRLNLNKDQDNLSQDNWIYNELVEDFDLEEFVIKGKLGTISVMNSFLLHRASENRTSSNTRKIFILNFGRACDTNFSRVEPYIKSKKFYNSINKDLTSITYKRSTSIFFHLKRKFFRFANRLIEIFKKNVRRILYPKFIILRLNNFLLNFINIIFPVKRNYINIGGGPIFIHRRFSNLDQCFDTEKHNGRIKFDLVKDLPLPFENNQIRGVYTSHCLEHLTRGEIINILTDSYRVLKKDGVIRIVLPDHETMFDSYESRDASYFSMFKVKSKSHQIWKYDSWLRLVTRSFAAPGVDKFSDSELYENYKLMGRDKYIKYMVNIGENCHEDRKIPNAHKIFTSPKVIIKILNDIGFKNVHQTSVNQTLDRIYKNELFFNNTQPKTSFFIEATK